MDSTSKIKGYYIPKRIKVTAKLIGLNYNTFFVFVVFGAICLIIGSRKNFIGLIVAIGIIAVIYFCLFYIQTKLGPMELAKRINDYNSPIRYLKVKTSFKKIQVFKKRSHEI